MRRRRTTFNNGEPKAKGANHAYSRPLCWWCHEPVDDNSPYRGEAPEMHLPTGTGVFVCSPACPARPKNLRVWAKIPWTGRR